MRQRLELHPDSACEGVAALAVEVGRNASGKLALRYLIAGDTMGVHLPALSAPARADELWKRTCFEAFVGATDSPAYVEINLAPSGEWAAYGFAGYRDGMRALDEVADPLLESRHQPEGYELRAVIDLAASGLPASGAWRLAVSAVLEATGGAKSYWALAHPPGKPDFHHPDGFVLDLPAP